MRFGEAFPGLWGGSLAAFAGASEAAAASLAEDGAEVVYLVEIDVGTGAPVTIAAPSTPVMGGATRWGGGGIVGTVAAGTATLRYSNRGWIGEPDDSVRPNTPYPARLLSPGRLERSFSLRPWEGAGFVGSFGFLDLSNGDGDLDSLVQTPAHGRKVRVLTGKARRANGGWTDYADMLELFVARGGAWEAGSGRARLALSSWAPVLSGPANFNTYAGTGGLEGTAALAGVQRPLCFGECFNLSPVLINDNYQVFQFHDGRAHAVLAVRDRGAPYSFTADYADYAALAAAAPGLSVGEYATCLAQGLIATGTRPNGILTADVQGDAEGGYVSSTSLVLQRFLARRQGITDYSAAGLNQLNPGAIGYYTGGRQVSALKLLDDLIRGCGAVPGETRSGLLTAFAAHDPDAYPVDFVLRAHDVTELRPLPLAPPVAGVEARYRPNWTEQASDIAGSVSGEAKADYARPHRVARVTTSAGDLNAGATETAVLNTFFVDRGNAETVASQQAANHGVERAAWSITLPRSGLDIPCGANVEVSHPNLGGVRRFQVAGLSAALDAGRVGLSVWG